MGDATAREALAEVMRWVDMYGPPMVQFDGWAAVDRAARVALASADEETSPALSAPPVSDTAGEALALSPDWREAAHCAALGSWDWSKPGEPDGPRLRRAVDRALEAAGLPFSAAPHVPAAGAGADNV